MKSEGLKYDDEKIMLELIAPELLFAVGITLTYGANKYDAENWRKGINYKRIYGGVMRHMTAWFNGENKDPESGLPHLWHAATGMMFLITYEEHDMSYGDKFDDRPNMATSPARYKDLLHQTITKAKEFHDKQLSASMKYPEEGKDKDV